MRNDHDVKRVRKYSGVEVFGVECETAEEVLDLFSMHIRSFGDYPSHIIINSIYDTDKKTYVFDGLMLSDGLKGKSYGTPPDFPTKLPDREELVSAVLEEMRSWDGQLELRGEEAHSFLPRRKRRFSISAYEMWAEDIADAILRKVHE